MEKELKFLRNQYDEILLKLSYTEVELEEVKKKASMLLDKVR